ncbi:MAG: RlmE family RNA methyltransferase [Pseudomonadota bacterium]
MTDEQPPKPPSSKPPGKAFHDKTRTTRDARVRVKTAKGRKPSSTQWLQRQLNDPYVKEAQRLGYRSRAAFKLLEIDAEMHLLKPDMVIVDLGAAPGGWAQVALQKKVSRVIGIDLLPIDPLDGATFLQMDFMDNDAPDRLMQEAGGEVDLVLSDIAQNTVGHRATDHIRIVALVEAAALFAIDILKPGGGFVAKVFQGGAAHDVLTLLKQNFTKIKHVKPKSSRAESAEVYLVATGFKGRVQA